MGCQCYYEDPCMRGAQEKWVPEGDTRLDKDGSRGGAHVAVNQRMPREVGSHLEPERS